MDTLKDIALIEIVRRHLMQDQRLAGQSICISSCNGYIQVCGFVDTEEHKRLALDLASGVVGVRGVEDKIEIRDFPEENEDMDNAG